MEDAGRLSPHAKEDIYQLYNQGWTCNDLSLKYGILPERVKAVVWQRRYFYQEIMPFVDRTTWRLALEREFLVAVEQQFQDYGLDLDVLALRKRGIPRTHVTQNANDVAPSEELQKKIDEWKKNLKPYLRYYFVTRKTVGKGTKAYKLKDWVIHRGNGRHSVSETFKKVCYYSEKQPHRLPKKVRERLEEGPRMATKGYRMGSYTRSHIR